MGSDRNGMGSTIADFDGDGHLDWFVTAIERNEGNWLYRNKGLDANGDSLGFEDVTDAAGVRDGGWGWGTSFLDYDNDGDQDLIMTNGYPFDINYLDDQMRLWRNDGGTFTEIATGSGVTDTGQGRGLLTFDYDRDGDLDVFVVNNEDHPVLYRNDGGNDNDWLQIETEGTVSNRDGIGAFIKVILDQSDPDNFIVQHIDGGSNFLAQNEMIAHFGLGDLAAGIETVDLVEIHWPSGIVQKLADVPLNSRFTAVEPRFTRFGPEEQGPGIVSGGRLVPEPATSMLLSIASLLLLRLRRP